MKYIYAFKCKILRHFKHSIMPREIEMNYCTFPKIPESSLLRKKKQSTKFVATKIVKINTND